MAMASALTSMHLNQAGFGPEPNGSKLIREQNNNWPTMLVVYEPGFHDMIAELLMVFCDSVCIRVIKTGSQSEALSLLASTRVNLFFVAGRGSTSIDPATGYAKKKAGEVVKFDGLAAGKAIANAHPKLPGVFCSGYCLRGRVMAQIYRHGMAFLPKPFDVAQLHDLLLLLLWRDGKPARQVCRFLSRGLVKLAKGDSAGARRDFTEAKKLIQQHKLERSTSAVKSGEQSGVVLAS